MVIYLYNGTWDDFLGSSVHDYAAARHCLRSSLSSGFTLAQQAIEKLLKAIIFTKDPKFFDPPYKLTPSEKHDLVKLFEIVQKMYPDIVLTYDCYLPKLSEYFRKKYPDKGFPDYSNSCSLEYKYVDQIYLELTLQFPVKDQRFYNYSIYHMKNTSMIFGHQEAIIKDNPTLEMFFRKLESKDYTPFFKKDDLFLTYSQLP